MIKRIVEIGSPARLSLRHGQMVIVRQGEEDATVPIEDLGVLILEHPAVQHTQRLLSACLANNVSVLICDGKRMPCAILLPLEGHSLHAKILRSQTALGEPARKRLWQAIVQAKVLAQARTLDFIGENGGPLRAMAVRVRSGDPENVEARAARAYWPLLFGKGFRRGREGGGPNPLLNYGYAVLRAAVARAIVGAGLHPALGLHHKNQYNPFCLADDLMEPLRPLADRRAHVIWEESEGRAELGPETKRGLLEVLTQECRVGDRGFPLMTALHYYAAGVRKRIEGEDIELEIPEAAAEREPAGAS
jgi:CRISPR-associated protein Cas1